MGTTPSRNGVYSLKMMGRVNIMTKCSHKFFTKKFLTKILEKYLELYRSSEGNVRATFEIVTVMGWK
jgi:hypothetical protein